MGRTYGADARAAGFTPGPRETDEERMLRSTLLARMVRDADDPAFQKEALALAWRWLGERKTLAPEMIDVVLGLAAWTGDANLYERLLADARAAADKQDRDRLLGALAGFRDPTLVKRSLDLVMDGGFEILDSVALLWGATGTRTGRRLAFAYVRANYDKLAAKLPEEWRASLVGIGADCTPEALAETEAFFGPRTPKERGGERAYKNTVEGMRLCVARRAADLASFGEFLRAQAGKSARAK